MPIVHECCGAVNHRILICFLKPLHLRLLQHVIFFSECDIPNEFNFQSGIINFSKCIVAWAGISQLSSQIWQQQWEITGTSSVSRSGQVDTLALSTERNYGVIVSHRRVVANHFCPIPVKDVTVHWQSSNFSVFDTRGQISCHCDFWTCLSMMLINSMTANATVQGDKLCSVLQWCT